MENTTEPTTTAAFLPEPARPQFLSVLCILTWISCGILFITTVWGVAFKPSKEEQYEQIEKIREMSPEAADKMEAVLEKQDGTSELLGTALSLIAIGLSAYGAYLMWQLRRRGFYFYVAGEVLPYLGFLTGGAEAMAALGSIGGGATASILIGIMVILDVVFIAMYAMNLKHMRNP
jgi:hypothetical protein